MTKSLSDIISGQFVDAEQRSQRPFSVEEVMNIGLNLAALLEQAHANGIRYRNICPNNIFCNDNLPRRFYIENTSANVIINTVSLDSDDAIVLSNLAYLPPELSGYFEAPDHICSDLYALGAVLYYLCVGNPPFVASSLKSLIHSILSVIPVSVSKIRSDVPILLSDIIQKLLRKDPEKRYASAAGLSADLKESLKELRSGDGQKCYALGKKDAYREIAAQIPFVGRQLEEKQMLQYLDNANTSSGRAVFIGAPSGMGKTRLSHQIVIAASNLKFKKSTTKCVDFERNIPFACLRPLLIEMNEEFNNSTPKMQMEWRSKVKETVGENSSILFKRIPQLRALITESTEMPSLEMADEEQRFYESLARLICMVPPGYAGNFTLFDDLQWVDASTLNLIKEIITLSKENALVNSFFLGTFRSEEVIEGHSLFKVLFEVNEVEGIYNLGPLSLNETSKMVSYLLEESEEEIKEIGNTTFLFTGGNPFFIHEYIKSVFASGTYIFDSGMQKWRFDAQRAQEALGVESLLSLVSRRMKCLSPRAFHLLTLTSVLGSSVSLSVVTTFIVRYLRSTDGALSINDKNLDTHTLLNLILDELIREHLIIPNEMNFLFFHDKIVEVAASYVNFEIKTSLHRDYGVYLFESHDRFQFAELPPRIIFATAYHLSEVPASERPDISNFVFYKGAQRAQGLFAYEKAREYLEYALETIPSSARDPSHADFAKWADQKEMLADLDRVLGRTEAAINAYIELLKVIEDSIRRAEIYGKKAQTHFFEFQYELSSTTAIEGLRVLGVSPIGSNFTAVLYVIFCFLKITWLEFCENKLNLKRSKKLDSRRDLAMFALFYSCLNSHFYTKAITGIGYMFRMMAFIYKFEDCALRSYSDASYAVILSVLGFDNKAEALFRASFRYFEEHPNPYYKAMTIFPWGAIHDLKLAKTKEGMNKIFRSHVILRGVGEGFWRISVGNTYLYFAHQVGYGKIEQEVVQDLEFLYSTTKVGGVGLGGVLRYYLVKGMENELQRSQKLADEASDVTISNGFKSLEVAIALLSSGEVYLMQGNTEAAIERLEIAWNVMRDERQDYSRCLLAPVFLSQAYVRDGQLIKALKPLKHVRRLAKRIPFVSAQLSLVEAEYAAALGNRMQASIHLEAAIEEASSRGFHAVVSECQWVQAQMQQEKSPLVAKVLFEQLKDRHDSHGEPFLSKRCAQRIEELNLKIAQNEVLHEDTSGNLRIRRKVENSALLEMFLSLSSIHNTSELSNAVLKSAAQCGGAEWAVLFLTENKNFIVKDFIGINISNSNWNDLESQGIDTIFLNYCINSIDFNGIIRDNNVPHSDAKGSVLVLPLIHQNVVSGYIYLANRETNLLFDNHTLKTLMPLATQAAIAFENIELLKQTRAQAVMEVELSAAKAVQATLLPGESSQYAGIKIPYFYRPTSHTGGDWLHYYLDEKRQKLFLQIGDVTGHGIPSALVTGVACGSVLMAEYYGIFNEHQSDLGAEILKMAHGVNRAIFETGSHSNLLMTMCFMGIDLNTGLLYLVNAGHNPPLVFTRGVEKPKIIVSSGSRLGYKQNPVLKIVTHQLKLGDTLFAYTDGLIENEGIDGQCISMQEIKSIFSSSASNSEFNLNLTQRIENLQASIPPEDDVAYMIFQWQGSIQKADWGGQI